MYHDNPSTNSRLIGLSPQTLYRGLYVRIAKKLEIDPSYVSRVARGERRSPEVEAALGQEIEQISNNLGSTAQPKNKKLEASRNKRLKFFVTQERNSLRRDWLGYVQEDPNLRRIRISSRTRTAPVLPVVDEALRSMQFSLKEIPTKPMKAAIRHGEERRGKGYTPTTLLEEYNLIRRCIYDVAKDNLKKLDPKGLVEDLGQLGEVLDFQSQKAVTAFLNN